MSESSEQQQLARDLLSGKLVHMAHVPAIPIDPEYEAWEQNVLNNWQLQPGEFFSYDETGRKTGVLCRHD